MCQYFQDARAYAKQIINFLWPKTDLYISQQITKLKIMYHKIIY